MEKKFQKEIKYNKFLPYHKDLSDQADFQLEAIKSGLCKSVLLREIRPSLIHWACELDKYVYLYGLRFTKDDHILLVKLFYDLILMPGLELRVVKTFSLILSNLLKKSSLLTREDLKLEWRPLYELYHFVTYKNLEEDGLFLLPKDICKALESVIYRARVYFPCESTGEILAQFRPLMCVWDSIFSKACHLLGLFLPTKLTPEEHRNSGWGVWLPEVTHWLFNTKTDHNWEPSLFDLLARLAKDNKGHVTFDQHWDEVFDRILRGFKLALTDKGAGGECIKIGNSQSVDTSTICRFLVNCMGNGSPVQKRLDQLFLAVESYVHPSNMGSWQLCILDFMQHLPLEVCRRLHIERYKKPGWENRTPEEFKLTDEDIEKFVQSILPCALNGMFCKVRSGLAVNCLRYLAKLSPNSVIPAVLEKVYSSLETLTEPHRLLESLKTLSTVIQPMVGDRKNGGLKSHVISTMTGILPGLDPNDVTKTLLTLQALSLFTLMVPVVDCSEAVHLRDDLNKEEKEICSATALFEEYVNVYMDRVFAVIQAFSCIGGAAGSTARRRGSTSVRSNPEENSIKDGLYASFRSLLSNCSTEIYDIVVNRLYNFLVENVLEGKITAEILGELCFSAVRTNSRRTFGRFFSLFSKKLKSLVQDEHFNAAEEDVNVLWYLTLSAQIMRCDGLVLAEKHEEIMDFLKILAPLKFRAIYETFGQLLEHLCLSMSFVYICEYETDRAILDQPLEENLPIRHWAEPCVLKNYKPIWHEPSDLEVDFLEKILDLFVFDGLNKLVENPEKLKKEDTLKTLQFVSSCINGASSLLPCLSGNYFQSIDSSAPLSTFTYLASRKGSRTLDFNGKNIRTFCYEKLHTLMNFLLNAREDETKSLSYICSIYCVLLFQKGILKSKLDAQVRSLSVAKAYATDLVVGKKSSPKALLSEFIMVEHKKRLAERSSNIVTDTHMAIASDLFRLSTSNYSEVRIISQSVFDCFLYIFPYSYRHLLGDILKLLSKDASIKHEQFKGALYLLLGTSTSRSLLIRHDWEILQKIWPAVIAAQHSEKTSIVNLMDSVQNLVIENLQSFQIKFNFNAEAMKSAMNLWLTTAGSDSQCGFMEKELEKAIETENSRNALFEKLYFDLIGILVRLSNDADLHWRHADMAQSFLSILIRYDMRYPADAMKVFVNLLLHDAIKTRKMAVGLLGAVLKIHGKKSKKLCMKIDDFFTTCVRNPPGYEKFLSSHKAWPNGWGLRPDNDHMVYDPEIVPRTAELWKKSVFIEKIQFGFYCWPDEIKVYAPDDQQPECGRSRENLKPEEVDLFDFLKDEKNVEKLCALMSVEEKDDEQDESFSSTDYLFFQGIFRTYGDSLAAVFLPVMQKYVKSVEEPQQRLASEFLCGLLSGQKIWPFEKRADVWKKVAEPLLRSAWENVTTEHIQSWGTCLPTVCDSRDPRKFHWLIDLSLEYAKKPIDSSFNASCRLFLLQGTLTQLEWRVLPLWHQCLSIIEPHLSQPYQNIRHRLGSVLSTIFMFDVPGMATTGKWKPPNLKDFLLKIQLKLKILWLEMEAGHPSESSAILKSSVPEPQRKEAVLLYKTMLCFLGGIWNRTIPEIWQFFLPLLCYFENETSDDELKRDCHCQLMQGAARTLLPLSMVDVVLTTCEGIARNKWWKCRISMLKFLQVCIFSNLYNFLPGPTPDRVRRLVLKFLADCQVDVRQVASDTLSSLLHCSYLIVDDSLIDTLRQMTHQKNDPLTRHAGVLGLSAIVKCSPYTVPEHLPDVLMTLCPLGTCPGPLGVSIKKCLADFKRTHQDSWHEHKKRFTDDQLGILTDLLVSPNYYV